MTTFPVSASTLSETALGNFIKDTYQLAANFSCKLYRTGLNHTYFITDVQTTYVIRVYCYNWRTKTEIQEELRLLNQLKNNNLSVSFPIADKNGIVIQDVQAPEGLRHVVLFSFAKGDKIRVMKPDTCFTIGEIMAKIHNETEGQKIDRIHYDSSTLLHTSYKHLNSFFPDTNDAMKTLKNLGQNLSKTFNEIDTSALPKGIVHLDIWYDNLNVAAERDITIFDFDNCGNGLLILDVGYFCKQLFFIEPDKDQYEIKLHRFLSGYQSVRLLSETALQVIPEAGAAVFMYYLGVQAQRFDWSNIFLTKNYLNMFVARIETWMDYNKMQKIV